LAAAVLRRTKAQAGKKFRLYIGGRFMFRRTKEIPRCRCAAFLVMQPPWSDVPSRKEKASAAVSPGWAQPASDELAPQYLR
jgi:hypothetical protein